MPGRGDLSRLDRLQNGAPLLLGMTALGISAIPDEGDKLPKGHGEVLLIKEIKTLKIQHGKAGGIG